MVLFGAARLAVVGCGVGLLRSFAISRLVSAFLFEASATDPVIYAASVLVMIVAALLASALPAARADSADLVDALRAV